MKRLSLSIGAGILIFVIGFLLLLITYKLLGSPAWMMSAITWILIWPNGILAKAGVPYPGRLFSLSIGPIVDVAILSGLFYVGMTLLRKKSPAATPPPPPQFD